MKFSKIMSEKAKPEFDNQEETEEEESNAEDDDAALDEENSEQEEDDADASDAADDDAASDGEQHDELEQSEQSKVDLKPKVLAVIEPQQNVAATPGDLMPAEGVAKKPKTTAKPSKGSKPPIIQEMVDSAIKMLNEYHGSSLVAIKQYILANYPVTITESRMMINIKKYIKNSIASGRLIQVKRSFKLSPQARKEEQQKANAKQKSEKKKLKEKSKRMNAEKVGKVKKAKKPEKEKESEGTKKTKSSTKDDKKEKNKENKENKENKQPGTKAATKSTKAAAAKSGKDDAKVKKTAAAPLKAANTGKMKAPGKLNAIADTPTSPVKKTATKSKAENKPVLTVRKSIATLIIPPKAAAKKGGRKMAKGPTANELPLMTSTPVVEPVAAIAVPVSAPKPAKKAKK